MIALPGIVTNLLLFVIVSFFYCEFAPAQSTFTLSDELSFWHTQANSTSTYTDFSPTRVRREDATYRLRTFQSDAQSGKHFHEITVEAESGGITFIPRLAPIKGITSISFYFRKSNPKSLLDFSIHANKRISERFNPAATSRSEISSSNWQRITIALDEQDFSDNSLPERQELSAPPKKREDILSLFSPVPGNIHSIYFGLKNASPGDTLQIDNITTEHTISHPARMITGNVSPYSEGTKVRIRISKDRIITVKPNKQGQFTYIPPATTKVVELTAISNTQVFTPESGRYLEIGKFIPAITIRTQNTAQKKPVIYGNLNTSRYIYDDEYGAHIDPLSHFLIAVSENNQQSVIAELSTNSLGYIDRDRHSNTERNNRRVLVMGECHLMGVHISMDDSWWNESEAYLTAFGNRSIEVMSASFHYNPFVNSLLAYKTILQTHKPDLVLLPLIDPEVLNLNIPEYISEWLSADPTHLPTYQFELGQKGLIHKPADPDWLLYRIQMTEDKRKSIRNKYYSWEYVKSSGDGPPKWAKQNLATVGSALAEFNGIAKSNGTKVAVLYISNFHLKSNRTENGNTYTPNTFRETIRKMSSHAGVEFIDISSAIHQAMPGDDSHHIFYKGNGHLTSYGHYRLGQALARILLNSTH